VTSSTRFAHCTSPPCGYTAATVAGNTTGGGRRAVGYDAVVTAALVLEIDISRTPFFPGRKENTQLTIYYGLKSISPTTYGPDKDLA
jgi:hypothetical protein